LFYVEQLMTPSFCMWNSQTEWKKNKKQKQKKNIIPILVLKQKTKHTHLKRCLNYNHLPQPLEICSPQKNYKKSPLEALTESKTQFLEQDPNADDYDKYSLPLGREDTNEEIIEEGTENTSSIESTRLKYWKYWSRYQIEYKLDMQEAVARID